MIKSLDEANQVMTEMKKAALKADGLFARKSAAIQKAGERYDTDIQTAETEYAEHKARLVAWIEKNPEQLNGGKTLKLSDGQVGVKTNPPKLVTTDDGKIDADRVQSVKAVLRPYIRQKDEIDKAKLIADSDKPTVKGKLQKCGLAVVQETNYFAKHNEPKSTYNR